MQSTAVTLNNNSPHNWYEYSEDSFSRNLKRFVLWTQKKNDVNILN
jgi:hypothetical protein